MPSLINNFYEFDEFRLYPQNRLLRRGEEAVPLTPKAFEVLLLLVQHGGQVITKDELMQAVWSGSFVEESNLTQTIFMLRKALGETPEERYILTMPGRGYRFVAAMKEVSGNGHAAPDASVATSEHAAAVDVEVGAPGSRMPLGTHSQYRKSPLLFVGTLCIILTTALVAHFYRSGSRTQEQGSQGRLMLAVLPFQNLTGDPSQDYFSDGLTEEMITQLGNLDPQHVAVIARTSVMHYKNTQAPLDQIGRELNVQYVLEGSVRRDGERLRIAAQLIQMKDQTHLWAREYDRELKDMLTVQGEIAQEIGDEIQLTLMNGRQSAGAAPQPALSPEAFDAYDLYLKGRYAWNKRQDFNLAANYFQQSIAKQPGYARAYTGLADTYALMSNYGFAAPAAVMPKARAAALKALQLDDGLAEAHTSLALIAESYDWDWKSAEKEYRRAIQLNPNYATAHQWYAEYLAFQGRFDEALTESERARQLDPLSLIIAADRGAIFYFARQYDRAIEQFRAVLHVEPDAARAHLVLAAYVQKGQFKEALESIEQWRRVDNGPWTWAVEAYVYGRAGQQAQARQALLKMEQANRRWHLDPVPMYAMAYAGMNQKDEAIAWLEKAFAQHSNVINALKVDPVYDPLRSDPRFADLLRRVGFSN